MDSQNGQLRTSLDIRRASSNKKSSMPQEAKKIVEEIRRDFINFEVMYRRSRKGKQI